MSGIDYRALREAAVAIETVATPQKLLAFRMKVTPSVVLTLLDERETAESKLNEQREYYEGVIADGSKRIAEPHAIVAAAEKLVRCKGRYHSELNYRALAALFGVRTPDLPPVEELKRDVELPAGYELRDGHPINSGERAVMIPHRCGRWLDRFDVEHALRAAGMRVKGEED
ncbi:Ead protein [Escherichia coli M056]|nr:Ead protein [Escherichia coli M056]